MAMNGGMHASVRELERLFNDGSLGTLSDGQLLDRLVERREASAFEAIVERFGPLVLGVCRRVLRDHHDAEDAFQATFLVLARKAPSVMPREKLRNWLYGVAFHTAMKARAIRAKRRVRERRVSHPTESEAMPDERVEELLARLDREVTRLPEKYRMPIILCELEGKTHRQAAEQLGWPVGTVSGRLSRAKALLASRLSRGEIALTVGSLAVLLARDGVSACVPPELVHSTSRAASLATAGVVSARVAALTGEVLKTMLLKKLKVLTAMFLVALAVAAGGTSLAYRAQATEPPSQQTDSQIANEQSTPTELVKDEIPQPKSTEPAQADTEPAKNAEPVKDDEMKPSYVGSEAGSGGRQRTLQYGAYSFTALQSGKAVLAYNAATRDVKVFSLHATEEEQFCGVIPVAIKSTKHHLVAIDAKGNPVSRVAVFNLKLGKWTPLELDQPLKGHVSPISFGDQTVGYEVGDFFYLYNPKEDVWDRLDVRASADDKLERTAKKRR
jgi:RNA polymerase sigma factor (sigma-70 family)